MLLLPAQRPSQFEPLLQGRRSLPADLPSADERPARPAVAARAGS